VLLTKKGQRIFGAKTCTCTDTPKVVDQSPLTVFKCTILATVKDVLIPHHHTTVTRGSLGRIGYFCSDLILVFELLGGTPTPFECDLSTRLRLVGSGSNMRDYT
jgi:hypothetical protein